MPASTKRRSLFEAWKSKLSAVDEFQLIQRYFVRANEAEGVITGIGDDGAVIRPDTNLDLVTVIDTLVEGVHFPADLDAADIAYRAVAVNLSDIAAMGARPRWMTLALTLSQANEAWLDAFATGLFDAASEYDVALVGGDMTSGEKTVVSVQGYGRRCRGLAGAAISRPLGQLFAKPLLPADCTRELWAVTVWYCECSNRCFRRTLRRPRQTVGGK